MDAALPLPPDPAPTQPRRNPTRGPARRLTRGAPRPTGALNGERYRLLEAALSAADPAVAVDHDPSDPQRPYVLRSKRPNSRDPRTGRRTHTVFGRFTLSGLADRFGV